MKMAFFTEIKIINPKIHMEAQKAPNTKSNAKQKEKCKRYQNP
jgi:hypothetical protein